MAPLSREREAQADALGVEMVTFSPSGDSDIAGQMKQLQDVATQGFDAVILSTHDENAAGPLVKKLDEAGIPVVIFNSDIADFPAPSWRGGICPAQGYPCPG